MPPSPEVRDLIPEAIRTLTRDLLNERVPTGAWEGELSTSALSTATSLFALHLAGRGRSDSADTHEAMIRRALDWLAANANADGGWGDTLRSHSNLSTTTLARAAFNVLDPAGREAYAPVIAAAEAWIRDRVGSMEPAPLARAITATYGRDRTFSVPILTMCALAGMLGPDADGWKLFPRLPFELAAFPRRWHRHLRLPVVSYALPALIAIGQVQHRFRPSVNPALRALRQRLIPRTLAILDEIQPASGGFLEAAPLTGFVAMSLCAAGHADHPVVRRGTEFLVATVRPDGSWPIDTNLSSWVSHLAINALTARVSDAGQGSDAAPWPDDETRATLRRRLLSLQYSEPHPFTNADPGGWAWTDLSGGVPDSDDTPCALLALHALSAADDLEAARAAGEGVRWLLDLQNSDGGIPTFCRGWGLLPFDRSGADLTAHTIRAWLAWLDRLPPGPAARTSHAIEQAVEYLRRRQRADGSWLPLWFGCQDAPENLNPVYGTGRVLAALADLIGRRIGHVEGAARMGVRFLLDSQNPDGGWGGAAGVRSSVEDTAVALDGICRVALSVAGGGAEAGDPGETRRAAERATARLCEAIRAGEHRTATPIGFYFANLWYFERLYPHTFALAALKSARRLLNEAP